MTLTSGRASFSGLDGWLDELQQSVNRDALKKYGAHVVARWKKPIFMGRPPEWNCSGRVTGECGDTLEIFLVIEQDQIQDCGFIADGCASSVVSGSACCEAALGCGLEEAMSIKQEDVLQVLDGLPEEDRHCAHLAAKALQAAVHDWMTHSQYP